MVKTIVNKMPKTPSECPYSSVKKMLGFRTCTYDTNVICVCSLATGGHCDNLEPMSKYQTTSSSDCLESIPWLSGDDS